MHTYIYNTPSITIPDNIELFSFAIYIHIYIYMYALFSKYIFKMYLRSLCNILQKQNLFTVTEKFVIYCQFRINVNVRTDKKLLNRIF